MTHKLSRLAAFLTALAGATLAGTILAATGCTTGGGNTRGSGLGVLPLRPPAPAWLGSIGGGGTSATLRGAAALTESPTPGWWHVLVSIKGGRPGAAYDWTLRSGACSTTAPAIGPANRFPHLTVAADGTAAAEATVQAAVSPRGSYSVTVSGPDAAPLACADLAYTAM